MDYIQTLRGKICVAYPEAHKIEKGVFYSWLDLIFEVEEVTKAQFLEKANVSDRWASEWVNILLAAGVIIKTGKRGTYARAKEFGPLVAELEDRIRNERPPVEAPSYPPETIELITELLKNFSFVHGDLANVHNSYYDRQAVLAKDAWDFFRTADEKRANRFRKELRGRYTDLNFMEALPNLLLVLGIPMPKEWKKALDKFEKCIREEDAWG